MFKNTLVSSKKYGSSWCGADVLHFRRCVHAACNRPFKMIRLMGQTCGLSELGKLICPHCGLQNPAESGSIYLSHALSAREEIDFISWNPDKPAPD